MLWVCAVGVYCSLFPKPCHPRFSAQALNVSIAASKATFELLEPNGKNISQKNKMKNNEAIRQTKNFDELLDVQYGKVGTQERDAFEEKAQYFVISELLKDARKGANMTQQQLAERVGTKKSYISRLENGKCDIQLSTLYRIFEDGLGKRISLIIA